MNTPLLLRDGGANDDAPRSASMYNERNGCV
jgi:hypothetical protein